jgi:dTMP kinase
MPFLVLEGGEGSGKDTQIELLGKKLDPHRTIFTREPGGTPLGEKLRSILMSEPMVLEAELLIFLASRAELIRTVIRPHLAQGKLVISNRFGLSTIAYQIYGRKRPDLLEFLKMLSKQVLGDLEPPHYILIDVDPEVGLDRVGKRGEKLTVFDAERLGFHMDVRKGYLAHYNDNGRGVCLNGAASIREVEQQIAEQMKLWNL